MDPTLHNTLLNSYLTDRTLPDLERDKSLIPNHTLKLVKFKDKEKVANMLFGQVLLDDTDSPVMKSKYSEFGLIKSILKRSQNPVQYLKPRLSAVTIGSIFKSPYQTSKSEIENDKQEKSQSLGASR